MLKQQSRGDSKECCRPSLSSEKGGFSLTEKEYKEHIQYTHNAYCRIVIRHASIDAARMLYTLLRELVEKIVVHECSYDENGTRRQDIEIYYSFVGKVDLPE